MSAFGDDTDPAAAAVLLQVLREASPSRKAQMAFDAATFAKTVALAGLQQRFPDASERELFRRYVDLSLGAELARAVYGPLDEWR